MSNLSDDQKQKFRELHAEARAAAVKINFLFLITLVAGVVCVNVVNQLFVQNDYFVVAASAMTGIFVFRHATENTKARIAELREKGQEILRNK